MSLEDERCTACILQRCCARYDRFYDPVAGIARRQVGGADGSGYEGHLCHYEQTAAKVNALAGRTGTARRVDTVTRWSRFPVIIPSFWSKLLCSKKELMIAAAKEQDSVSFKDRDVEPACIEDCLPRLACR